MASRPGYPGERARESARDGDVRVASGTAEPSDGGVRGLPFTRRGFFARASTAALAAFAAVAGAPDLARAAGTADAATSTTHRPQPPPCRVRCEPVSRTGCACGGHLYRCRGCGTSFHACIDGKPYTWVCLRRNC